MILSVPEEANGMRLDVFLLKHVGSVATRSTVQRAIREQLVRIDEKKSSKPSSAVHTGQTVRVDQNAFAPPKQPQVIPDKDIPLDILHDDEGYLVINKQPGIPVHSGDRNEHPTIVDALIARYPSISSIGEDPLRPGIVHRLDQDTSGVLIIAKTQEMFLHLKYAFAKRKIEKFYLALVRGVMKKDENTIKKPIMRNPRNPMRQAIANPREGRSAETHYLVRERFEEYTLVEVRPVTGRMHQIRVHLAHLGYPIAGDVLYGKQKRITRIPGLSRQFLHAASLTVIMPDRKKMRFESPLPDDLTSCLETIRGKTGQSASKTY